MSETMSEVRLLAIEGDLDYRKVQYFSGRIWQIEADLRDLLSEVRRLRAAPAGEEVVSISCPICGKWRREVQSTMIPVEICCRTCHADFKVREALARRDGEREALVRERAALIDLEEGSAEVAKEMGGTPEQAFAFIDHVYRTLHWLNSPECRKNHPAWEPKLSEGALRHANRTPEERREQTSLLLAAFDAARLGATTTEGGEHG